jgi:hypothetical protein
MAPRNNGQQDVPLVVGLFLLVLAMVSMGNMGLSIANSRDIYKINAKIKAMNDKDSHSAFPRVIKLPDEPVVVVAVMQEDDTSLELVPHPVYTNVMTSKMVYPNITISKSVTRDRASWWSLGASKLANTGDAIYGLASDCKTWTGSDDVKDPRKLECVYGAISTLITMGGAGHTMYAHGAEIARKLKTWYSTKDAKSEPSDSKTINSALLEYQNFLVNISQSPMALMFDSSANPITYNDTGLPIMFGINGKGDGMLVSYQPKPSNIFEATAIYSFVPPPPSGSLRNSITYFNQEDFVSNSLEAAYSFTQTSDSGGGWPSENNNNDRYGQMDHEVSCLFGDLTGNSYAWQIYDNDNDHGGTIAGGAIRRGCLYTACKEQIPNSEIRGGVPRLQRCQVV